MPKNHAARWCFVRLSARFVIFRSGTRKNTWLDFGKIAEVTCLLQSFREILENHMVKSRSHVANIAEVTCFHGPIGSPFLLGPQKHVVPGAQSSPDHVKRRGLYYCTTVFSFPVLSSPAARRRRGRARAARTREESRTRRDTAGTRPGQGQDTPTRPGHGQDTARTRPGRQETARTRPGRSRQDKT